MENSKAVRIKKRHILLGVFVGMLVLVSTYGASYANADFNSADGSLVQKIAEKFNLKESDVQGVFDEFKKEHRGWSRSGLESRLDEAVTKGDLTEDQKVLLLDKFAEWQSEHEEMMRDWSGMTDDERQAAMDAHHDQMEAWAEENNIDLDFLHMQRHVNDRGLFHGHMGRGPH